MKNYDDIINETYIKSKKHPWMSQADRAAQFAPFAALTGHKEEVKERERLTKSKRILDDNQKIVINETLQKVLFHIHKKPMLKITYFCFDEKKEGGEYLILKKQVKGIDEVHHTLVFLDHTRINIDDIYDLEEIDMEV